jgi:hypothetical protein
VCVRAFVFASVMLAACGAAAQAPPSATPDWMSGYWLSCANGETAENWFGAGTGVLLGTNLSGGGFEFLRIAANEQGGVSYYAMPGGSSPPTEFAMVSHEGERAMFENTAHDFPQRVIYAREGDLMTARIDGRDQAMEWRFARAEPDARCPS